MDYLIARWFIVMFLDLQTLETLHKFEKTFFDYANKYSLSQELCFLQSGRFLQQEFIKIKTNNKIFMSIQFFQIFEGKIQKIIKDNLIKNEGVNKNNIKQQIFNIAFMHKCDTLLNTATKTYQNTQYTS